jgi:hypothetical protein
LRNALLVHRIVRDLPGGSRPVLTVCENRQFVVKCPQNPQGPNTLANEVLASELMQAIGLPTPKWEIVTYKSSPVCIMMREVAGSYDSCHLHFASTVPLVSNETRLYSFLPGPFTPLLQNRMDFVGALIFDIWTGSTDSRQALYTESENGLGFEATFVDHGHCFGGPFWKFDGRPGASLCRNRQVYADALTPGVINHWISQIRALLPSRLDGAFQRIPEEWYKGNLEELKRCLLHRLDFLDKMVWDELQSLDLVLRPGLRGPYGNRAHTADGVLSRRPKLPRDSDRLDTLGSGFCGSALSSS